MELKKAELDKVKAMAKEKKKARKQAAKDKVIEH